MSKHGLFFSLFSLRQYKLRMVVELLFSDKAATISCLISIGEISRLSGYSSFGAGQEDQDKKSRDVFPSEGRRSLLSYGNRGSNAF